MKYEYTQLVAKIHFSKMYLLKYVNKYIMSLIYIIVFKMQC